MAIIRRQLDFEQIQFTRIPNVWIRDERLSLQSKGLLTQLLSHTNGWSVSIQRLAAVNGCGEHTIRKAVNELESFGYLTRSQEKDDTGRFLQTLWETSSPVDEIPHAEIPLAVDRALKKKTEKKTIEKNSKPTPLPDDFMITDDMRQWANTTVPDLDIDWHTQSFVDYWRSRPRDATKKDWVATWRNWMRKEFERKPKSRQPRMSNAQRNLANMKKMMGELE